jgi:ribosome-binding ATPase YchF (GTP1/OBG family)
LILSDEERREAEQLARELNLLTSKSEILVLNVDEGELKNQETLINEWAKKLGVAKKQVVLVSAKVESELASLADGEQALFLTELGLSGSGLNRLARVAYQTLGLQSFLTAGALEVRAWTIPAWTRAQDAAGVIHTDFICKFIKAKVCSYSDFVKYHGWKQAGSAGKVRLEGKDYIMQEDDIVEFILAQ